MLFKEVLDFLAGEIVQMEGHLPDEWELHLADAKHVDSHTLDWDALSNTLSVKHGSNEVDVRIVVKDAKRTIAEIGNRFFAEDRIGIHPTAIIESGAKIGDRCYIGPYVHISGCVEIGKNVKVNAGTVLGNAGFGFVRDRAGNLMRFPQLGRLIVGDSVEIGSNVTIDRGALSDTIIGRNTKINNLVHIAHNVRTGANVVITAQVNISGSVIIGDNVWIGPGSTVRDHISIGCGAYIGIGSNVVKDVPANETWCGNPARKLR